jgi:hypothetical protein
MLKTTVPFGTELKPMEKAMLSEGQRSYHLQKLRFFLTALKPTANALSFFSQNSNQV